jgi:nitrogen regulatory protein P-II 1
MSSRVIAALHELPHFPGLTLFEVSGQGRGSGPGGAYEHTEESIFENKRRVIEVICVNELAEGIAETIRRAAHTGTHGDGIIVITDISDVIRIRSDERQERAV